jgi:GDP-4-dehydro-6-deoxy-D-mannose reductase
MRVLVTGADGFVGPHLCRALEAGGDSAVPVHGPRPSVGAAAAATHLDVRDANAVRELFTRVKPDAVVHLAGVSSVAFSHGEPAETFAVNALGTLNVCVAARELGPGTRLLVISSGEVYGSRSSTEPAAESAALQPTSPYAASKVAAETVGLQFARAYGLHVVCARPFNHLGAGQAPSFAIPSFARQLAKARATRDRVRLSVGNLEPVRDFSHVDDVVQGYRLLLERGVPGDVYNVCSGHGRSIRSILDELVTLARVAADIVVDPAKLRPADIPSLVGDPARLKGLGWTPRRTVRDALAEVLAEAEGEQRTPAPAP